MKIYGADFSGGRDASKGIYYAEAQLRDSELYLNKVVHCDDRLDLFAAILHSKAPWGLDFPFALPQESYPELGLKSWNELLQFAVAHDRDHFMSILNDKLPNHEVCSKEKSHLCRYSDVYVKTFSPLKRYNPNLRSMLYGGLKMLAYLRQCGSVVYPFDELDLKVSRIYEVYPSYLWAKAKMRRTTNLKKFADVFNEMSRLKLVLGKEFYEAPNQDFADAVLACLMMAQGIVDLKIEKTWNKPFKGLTAAEWQVRNLEGIILRLE